jgi:hypothetical protein
MANGTYEYQSDFAKRYYAQGKEEGHAEGRAQSILDVLRVRGVDVPAEVRERIVSCKDVATLDAWLERAVRAASAADVLSE